MALNGFLICREYPCGFLQTSFSGNITTLATEITANKLDKFGDVAASSVALKNICDNFSGQNCCLLFLEGLYLSLGGLGCRPIAKGDLLPG